MLLKDVLLQGPVPGGGSSLDVAATPYLSPLISPLLINPDILMLFIDVLLQGPVPGGGSSLDVAATPDLSHLTPEERAIIQGVMIKQQERERAETFPSKQINFTQ
jgi:hypothetical protein